MKVLAIMVDVSKLTKLEISELRYAMEVQCEEAGGKCKAERTDSNVHLFDAPILSSKVKDIPDDDTSTSRCRSCGKEEEGDAAHCDACLLN